ncbi:hypothetical protein O1R50_23825 [Glycomyces luteolus]|uniref:Uncharacterized protein n=1 Tax=Glycomyces luteolus TaxID=2670330 RepID=A0A9X3PFB6_9ACTN|nr:hypothetical protein [Glycomyces luteolus]MDA1362672.1 hypothetical protein [Glycomyces luteolus]
MSDDLSDTPEQQVPQQQFASVPAFQGMLIVHALAAGIIGVPAWMITIGFGVMGADSMSDFYAIHFFYLVVFGMTPGLNLLATIHLPSRPARAKRYLAPVLVFAWIQVSCGALFAVVAAASAFIVPLFFAILYTFVVVCIAKATSELEAGGEGVRSGRLVAVDLAVFTLASAVLAIPVAVFGHLYRVF